MQNISYQFILSFLMTVVFVAVAFFVDSRYKDRRTLALTYNIFVLSVASWCGSMAMFYHVSSRESLIFWAKSQFFTGGLIATSILLLSFIYPKEEFSFSMLKRILVFLPNAAIFYLCYFTSYIVKDVAIFNGIWGWVRGDYHLLWHAYFGIAVVVAFVRFSKALKNAAGTIKYRLKYIIAGLCVGVSFSAIPSILMPWLLNRFELYWMGAPLTLVWVVFVAYVIFKKPLMEIPKFVRASLLYAILFALLAYLQFLFISIFKAFFPALSSEYVFSPFATSIAFVAIILIPARKLVENYVNKYIFNEDYFSIVEENKALREEVADTEKYKSLATLFNRIIFEIKNPLTTLKGYSYCLPEKTGDKDFLVDFAKTLREEVDRINDLVNHLAEYSRPSSLMGRKMEMYAFVDETINLLKNSFAEINIRILKKYNSDQKFFMNIDPKQLQQAFLNIFSNSIDAMPDGGDLRIHLVHTEEHFKISISDSGCGIRREVLNKIMEPFYTTKSNNQGLGLSVAYGIIEQHSGTLHIESEENIGTEIIIELPVHSSFGAASDVIRIG